MSHSTEDEAELQYLLRQLLKSTKDRISGAPSIECAEEILLHLEETDKNFHNYEFVRYLRQYVDRSLGVVVEAETEHSAGGDSVRWEALQKLCCAPPADVLSCESWSSLRTSLSAVLDDPDPDLSDKVLKFFAKTSSSSPFNLTREIYSSLAKSLERYFLSHKLSLPIGSDGIDVTRPDISRLLKQMRLMNDFQKEMPTFWIRHPEKYVV
ncbi:hypothetical protein CRUP_018690 [Coryphaenoides rupestris]|nr:hypothetical protein CRUP_018690 [Coryphaenoides rupestris]